ncbi:unnamed protein product [Didymodactylos carnosus]|uniref:NADP-dependent oxidoreductase domain-containing protein n=1 Tax=Didymodactylos carnosus TaxID=1234261 RepID=A0A814XZR1_9BILA|nr:unnamed protein product [Didymodactylos carnosus]CAF1222663.1 unnamed protein product [Didymodactylos carnosus]CAF3582610.1 unnamed protein product [Didymodactylos carnosus]CAF3985908.1 unnamed protein product [Didymodactylos carnosus]
MQYQKIGNTDIEVSRVILGCENSGGIGSVPSLLYAAVRLGITTFDTADGYGCGRSETYIGNWLRKYDEKVRSNIVLSSKTYNPMFIGDSKRLSKERISKQIDGTLERLGIKQLDMYLSHERDDETPLEEILSCFNELQKSGKVRANGASNINCEQLEKSISICDDLDLNENTLCFERISGNLPKWVNIFYYSEVKNCF